MSQYADFVAQIESLPELVRTEARPIDDRMRLLLKTPEIYGIRQVVLVGSGDSYFAAQAAVPAIRAWTGLPVVAMLAMEAARYVDAGVVPLGGQTRGLLVVAISNSGEAARVVEATQRLRTLGALTLAITAAPDSRLASAAERGPRHHGAGRRAGAGHPQLRRLDARGLFGRPAPRRGAALHHHGRGECAARRDRRRERCAWPAAVQLSAAPIREVVDRWRAFSSVDVLGSGPALASAGYGAAKLVEAAGLHATAQDAEEFHHLNYFVADLDHVPAVAFAAGAARAASRTRELVGTSKVSAVRP